MPVKSLTSLKWNPTVCLSCPSLPAAAKERLPHPVWAAFLWPLVLKALREKERKRGGRDGRRHHTRGSPRRHHHQAAPDSSYHAWAALWRAAAGQRRERTAAGERRVRETCTLSRTDSAVERHVNHLGYYCRAGHGTLQLSEPPHWILHHCS